MWGKLRAGVLAALLATVTAVPASELDADEARQLRESGAILPLSRIIGQARDAQPGRVIEVELESEDGEPVYELEIIDAEGRVWELELDAATGRLLHRELED